jgi:hypothetical protein
MKQHGCCGPKIDRIEAGLREMRMMKEKSKAELLDMMMSLQGLLEEKEGEDREYDDLVDGYDSEIDVSRMKSVGRQSNFKY